MKAYSIISEEWMIDGGVCFGVVPKGIWNASFEADDMNNVKISNRLLLLQTDDRLILVDTGFGNKQGKKYYSYKFIYQRNSFEDLLKPYGFTPADITDVIFTHLHDDHVGGAVIKTEDGLKLQFPNARHWVSKAQYDLSINPNPREAASFYPENLDMVKENGLLELVENEGEIIPGVKVYLFNGHTEGQMIPEVEINGRKLVYAADFIPSMAHIPLPYLASVDIKPLDALAEKESFLKEALAEDKILFFEHDHYTECCTLTDGPKGIRGKEPMKLSDIFA